MSILDFLKCLHHDCLELLSQIKYLMGLSTRPDLAKMIVEFQAELRKFENQKIKPLNIFDRFKKAEMIEEYDSFYNFLCSEAHSDKRALINRHFEINGADFNQVIYKNGTFMECLPYLQVTADYLISATVSIHDKFKTEGIEEVASFRIAFKKIMASNKEGT